MNLDQSIWEKQFISEKNAVIIDVRTPEEFEISRIPNSKNIDFYNDSKSTNVNSAKTAIKSFKNIFWILGGREKKGGLKGIE